MKIDRRQALALFGLAAGPAAAAPAARDPGAMAFNHGVASGDPTPTSAIFWTRVTPADPAAGDVLVDLEVAADPAFKKVVRTAKGLRARSERDFTVKHDLDGAGLKPGTDYWYRFRATASGTLSPVGRTRTLPRGATTDVVLAVASCALYPNGYFNAYQAIADLPRVDAVLHLGDYIYEYGGERSYGMDSAVAAQRPHDPPHECLTLDDYRRRHAQYKTDPQLQAAHARAPWIVVWDDHETANDSYATGAENHQPEEGDWNARKAVALKAYFEWMPIRDPAGDLAGGANRSFQFGDLASLIMLETRLVARDKQLNYDRDLGPVDGPLDLEGFKAKLTSPTRRMMSDHQEAWLAGELAASRKSGHTWQVLGNQVVMARLFAPSSKSLDKATRESLGKQVARLDRLDRLAELKLPYALDMWDGYGAARDRLYAGLKAAGAHPIVVSGDSHAFWVNELWDAEQGGRRVAAEFGATGVTSPGGGDYIKGVDVGALFADRNREVLFSDQSAKGFVLLTLGRDSARGELIGVSTIAEPRFTARTIKTFEVRPSDGGGVEELREV